MSDACVIAPSPSCHSFFNSCSIFPISTEEPNEYVSVTAGITEFTIFSTVGHRGRVNHQQLLVPMNPRDKSITPAHLLLHARLPRLDRQMPRLLLLRRDAQRVW